MDFLNKILPCENLNLSIIVVTGPTRVGKSSYISARVRRDYLKNSQERFLASLMIVNQLRNNGYPNLRLDKNLYFANDWLCLDPKKGVNAWDFDVVKMGLPNKKYKVQNLPYGAVVVAFEADRQLNALDNRNGLNEYVRSLLKYHGHNKITLILDMQDFSRLAKEFRLLVHQIVYIKGKKSFRLFGKTLSTTWYTRVIDVAYLNLIKSLENFNIKIEEASYVKDCKFKYYGDIHQLYNAESGLAYFLDGVDHYDYVKVPTPKLDKDGIVEYLKRHPLIPPDSFKKGKCQQLENAPEVVKTKIDAMVKENSKKLKDYLYEIYRKGEFNDG